MRTSSAARSDSRSGLPSPNRRSKTTRCPSTYPSSRIPCLNASKRFEADAGVPTWRTPIFGIFPPCCAPVLGDTASIPRVSTTISVSAARIILPPSARTRPEEESNPRLADPSAILPPDTLTFLVVGPRMHLSKPSQHHSQGSAVDADLVRARHERELPNYPTERTVIPDDAFAYVHRYTALKRLS